MMSYTGGNIKKAWFCVGLSPIVGCKPLMS